MARPGRQPPKGLPPGTVLWGGPVDRSRVSLRVMGGDDLDPAEISRLLGCAPTRTTRRLLNAANGQQRIKAGWSLAAEGGPDDDLDSLVTATLAQVTDDLSVWQALHERYRLDLFCGLFLSTWNQGEELSPAVMGKLAARGLRIGFDIYAPDGRPVVSP